MIWRTLSCHVTQRGSGNDSKRFFDGCTFEFLEEKKSMYEFWSHLKFGKSCVKKKKYGQVLIHVRFLEKKHVWILIHPKFFENCFWEKKCRQVLIRVRFLAQEKKNMQYEFWSVSNLVKFSLFRKREVLAKCVHAIFDPC